MLGDNQSSSNANKAVDNSACAYSDIVIICYQKVPFSQKTYKIEKMVKNKKILSNIKEKPYFQKDKFVLYNSDCLKILEQIPENSVDMIFADPPYFLSNGGFTCESGKMVSVNKGKWDETNGLKKDFEFH